MLMYKQVQDVWSAHNKTLYSRKSYSILHDNITHSENDIGYWHTLTYTKLKSPSVFILYQSFGTSAKFSWSHSKKFPPPRPIQSMNKIQPQTFTQDSNLGR